MYRFSGLQATNRRLEICQPPVDKAVFAPEAAVFPWLSQAKARPSGFSDDLRHQGFFFRIVHRHSVLEKPDFIKVYLFASGGQLFPFIKQCHDSKKLS